mmetsp:Transcript_118110/g.252401  ORF Transcript_118110/g.252401 Transcript_118110/m.252401 type:complete len:797 (+) Transcript_118110:128-2518(+)
MVDDAVSTRPAGPSGGKSNKIPRASPVAEAPKPRAGTAGEARTPVSQAVNSNRPGRWQGKGETRGAGVQRGGRTRERPGRGKDNGLGRIADDMRARLVECAPTDEDQARSERCVSELRELVQELGPEWKLRLFGSVESGFGTRFSDIDATIIREDPPSPDGEEAQQPQNAAALLLERLGPLLREHRLFSVEEEILGAKVPILKCRFDDNLDVDLSYQNRKALQNTRLLKAYAKIDPRVRDLGIAVKLWARAAKVCGAAQGNLSSYTFTLMVIYFMQIHPDVMLPCLPTSAFEEKDGEEANMEKEVEKGLVWSSQCKLSLADLTARFFYFYSAYFMWGQEVVSPRMGVRHFRNDECFLKLRGRWSVRLHVEDPFLLERNLHCVLGDPEEQKLINSFKDAVRTIHAGRTPIGMRPIPTTPKSQPQQHASPVLTAEPGPRPVPVGALEVVPQLAASAFPDGPTGPPWADVDAAEVESEGNSAANSATGSPVLSPGLGPVLTPPVMGPEPVMGLLEAGSEEEPRPSATKLKLEEAVRGLEEGGAVAAAASKVMAAAAKGAAATSPGGFSMISTAASGVAMADGSPSPIDTSGGESQSSADEKAGLPRVAVPMALPGLSEEKPKTPSPGMSEKLAQLLGLTATPLQESSAPAQSEGIEADFATADKDKMWQGNPQEAEKPEPVGNGKWWRHMGPGSVRVEQKIKETKEEAGPRLPQCLTVQDLEGQMGETKGERRQDSAESKTKMHRGKGQDEASEKAAAFSKVLGGRSFLSSSTSKIMSKVTKALGDAQASSGAQPVQFQ